MTGTKKERICERKKENHKIKNQRKKAINAERKKEIKTKGSMIKRERAYAKRRNKREINLERKGIKTDRRKNL